MSLAIPARRPRSPKFRRSEPTVGRKLLPKLLPLDDFRVEGNELRFTDLGDRYDLRKPLNYKIEWAPYDERQDSSGPAVVIAGPRLPAETLAVPDGAHWVARIQDQERRQAAIYLRKQDAG